MSTASGSLSSPQLRIRDLGYKPGNKPTGPHNSILDVPGVGVAQVTLPTSSEALELAESHGRPPAQKGVTIILPRAGESDKLKPCHAGVHVFNGNGLLTGVQQIADWGFVNTPIIFTNSLSAGVSYDACWDFILAEHRRQGNDLITMSRNYGTPVVGETSDWWINGKDLAATVVSKEEIMQGFEQVCTKEQGGKILEGSYGGGSGMTCHEYKGGSGTASRVVGLTDNGKQYTVGVLVQTNHSHQADLMIGGVPIGRILAKESPRRRNLVGKADDGSLLVLIITDAPLLPHQLQRLARHATAGLALCSSYGSGRTFSGDIFLALSTASHPSEQVQSADRIGKTVETYSVEVVKNESIDCFFEATVEATEEAILNSNVGARDGVVCLDGSVIEGLPVERVKQLLKQHLVKID